MFSSVKLAVPILLILAAVVAVGTIIESRYNAEYAQLLVYRSLWFEFLIGILFTVIFFAIISRLPWKKRHTGFVITHLGMMTLLIGSWVTKYYGIDGQLRVVEGQENRYVFLDERVFEFTTETSFKKVLVPRSAYSLNFFTKSRLNAQLGDKFEILEYVPFAERVSSESPQFTQNGEVIQFRIKSKFFNEKIWLHSKEKQQIQMGPASFQLLTEGSPALLNKKKPPLKPVQKKKTRKVSSVGGKPQLMVYSGENNTPLKTLDLTDKKQNSFTVNGVSVEVINILTHATVSNNKLENHGGKSNPALELRLKKGADVQREVLFAKFPGFSMNKEGNFGLRFAYTAPDTAVVDMESHGVEPDQSTHEDHAGHNHKNEKSGNLVQFILTEDSGVRLRLSKNSETVLEQEVKINETVQTPWMGIEITILSREIPKLSAPSVVAVNPQPKEDNLPPSAIYIKNKTDKSSPFWLIEGQSKVIRTEDDTFNLFYGRNSIQLPFVVFLSEFFKKNYPGTGRAVSFESHVNINGAKDKIVISMNEPFYKEGFTLYQSSYDMRPNRPTASIFSVNRDIGRWVKYLGSLIMALGIVTYTMMKSRFYKGKRKK